MKAFLGVDGGGSRTRAILVDVEGRLLGRGQAGSANPRFGGIASALEHVATAVKTALAPAKNGGMELAAAHFGLAGASNSALTASIDQGLRRLDLLPPECALSVSGDLEIALHGAIPRGEGIVLIAGTGSACLGKDSAGKTARCGGWGSLLDDAGGAFSIGLEALRAVVRMADGRRKPSPLLTAVTEALRLGEVSELVDWMFTQQLRREEIASLAPVVFRCWKEGDRVAHRIALNAAEELTVLLETVARKLEADMPDVALIGGVANSGEPFQPMLQRAIQERLPGVQWVEPVLSPVQGAVLEALRASGQTISASILTRMAAARPDTNPPFGLASPR